MLDRDGKGVGGRIIIRRNNTYALCVCGLLDEKVGFKIVS